MNRTQRPRGFTLIELLVVIAIITILVSLIVTLVINVQRNAQVKRTMGTIGALQSALTGYFADFRTYPPVYINEMTDLSGTTTSTPSAIKRNETLFEYLTLKVKLGTKWFGPWLPDEQKNAARDTDKNGKPEFVDAWQSPLVFNMPGEDHSGDVNVDGKKVPGPNHMVLEESAGKWDLSNLKYDIYSYGPNLIDDSKATAATWAMRDRGVDGKYGYYKSGDSGDPPAHSHGDDVLSWSEHTNKKN